MEHGILHVLLFLHFVALGLDMAGKGRVVALLFLDGFRCLGGTDLGEETHSLHLVKPILHVPSLHLPLPPVVLRGVAEVGFKGLNLFDLLSLFLLVERILPQVRGDIHADGRRRRFGWRRMAHGSFEVQGIRISRLLCASRLGGSLPQPAELGPPVLGILGLCLLELLPAAHLALLVDGLQRCLLHVGRFLAYCHLGWNALRHWRRPNSGLADARRLGLGQRGLGQVGQPGTGLPGLLLRSDARRLGNQIILELFHVVSMGHEGPKDVGLDVVQVKHVHPVPLDCAPHPLHVEHVTQKNRHLVRFFGENEFAILLELELLETKKGQVRHDQVHGVVRPEH
mmetsp:Transcript_3089/g.8910  ORF Transcript_3089/g.8910 Transcript_3089/m.8910 type:complete len:340 (+) Transcript_3089:1167-2186(+)